MADPGFQVGRGGADLLGGQHQPPTQLLSGGDADLLGGSTNLRLSCFQAEMYAKMKELGPIGGGGVRRPPPGSANESLPIFPVSVGTMLGMNAALVVPKELQG